MSRLEVSEERWADQSARLSGIKVHKIKISLFMPSGALSASAGILLMSKLQRSDAVTGLGWESNVIAAAAVGGIKLTGGAGTLTGAFMGIIFYKSFFKAW